MRIAVESQGLQAVEATEKIEATEECNEVFYRCHSFAFILSMDSSQYLTSRGASFYHIQQLLRSGLLVELFIVNAEVR